ncbi:MAG: aminotransferase class III-fold pyridoxal phosphate-dependent enzyme, partial [Treponema sp.]|nr:aminotransferase class III-fold pyridoxal phosphate-dependent enzyme [Treponema sp.]
RVLAAGEKIRSEISSWKNPLVVQVRGKGLMIGIQIKEGTKPFDIEVECMKQGLCVSTAGSDVVRFLPPLIISDKEIDEGLKIFKAVLEKFN